jgi:MoaA/NifB/PqqE/SkfB family radical SAM enzyme
MLELGRELKVLEVFIFDVIPTGRLEEQRECALHLEEVQALSELRSTYKAKPHYPRIVHQSMFVGLHYPCIAQGCPAGVVQVHLRANGDVTPCDFTPYSFGNVKERPLAEIWQRLASDPLYATRAPHCRMADPVFRRKLEAHLQAV